jgi:hypothetical protein
MMDITQKYNRETFLSFLGDNFLPDDFELNKANVYINKKNAVITDAIKLGVCPSLDISVYEFKHQSKNDPRVTLSRESFNILKNNDAVSNAFAVFYNEDSTQWRLSLITSDYNINENKKRAERTFSNPRRYSYLLGENCKRHTPEQMLFTKGKIKSNEDMINRFAIDVVTKQFYQELFQWYEWAVPLVKYPEGFGNKVKLSQKDNNLHLIRLITRLIFVWFIKQKDLIPSWIFDENEIKNTLSDYISNSSKKGNYYNGILQNLFFATLNKAIGEREFTNDKDGSKQYGIKTLYRDHGENSLFSIPHKAFVKKFEKVPFLNGGLFECLDSREDDEQEYHDGFSREKNRAAFVPNCLFWGDKEGTHEGIISLFSRYNFTVEENTTQDIDIALDPELLGKVFENLLGTFNPETKETARNESGSFYTPREIVNYMVDISVKEYFKNQLSKSKKQIADINDKLDILLRYDDVIPQFTESEIETLITAIDKSKIIDPACGSGAFPMGILHKLTHILSKLDPKNIYWKETQRMKAIKETEEAFKIGDKEERLNRLTEINEVFETNSDDYSRKLYLIENCIFGVDIQPIAIQISKLRFFISLIVDQKIDTAKDNFGIRSLPNLETKFVAANTLIKIEKPKDFLSNIHLSELEKELLEIRHLQFSAKTASVKQKLRTHDKATRIKIQDELKEAGWPSDSARQVAQWDPYNQNNVSEWFDSEWMF